MGGAWRLGDPRWLTYFEVHHGQVPQYRSRRVLLAGDAAHVHSPAAGQGMNTGVQDAVNLAWKLALVSTGRAAPELRDTYQAGRRRVGARVVRLTGPRTDVMGGAGPPAPRRAPGLWAWGPGPGGGERRLPARPETTTPSRAGPAVTGLAGGRRHASPGD